MREVQLDDADDEIPIHTVLNYGDTRTGKTVFGATWPRPLIIADAMERGYQSIRTMDRDLWFEPDRKPIIWEYTEMSDLMPILREADPLIASGEVATLVFDAFSFYADFYLNGVCATQAKQDMRGAYGALGMHLRNARVQVHSRRTNVVWNCLAKHPEKDEETARVTLGGPLIPGQQGDKFSAGVDLLFYSRIEAVRQAGQFVANQHEIRTKRYKDYAAGHRLGIAEGLPDPFTGRTYAELIECLGYDSGRVREILKTRRPGPAVKAVPIASIARPPIASAAKVAMPPSGGNKPAVKATTK